jgi:uncharacterized iron-regulated membrane protein
MDAAATVIETVAVALACLGTIVTGISTAWLWVEHFRLERRIAKLEMDVRRLSWPPGVAHGVPPDAFQREWAMVTRQKAP